MSPEESVDKTIGTPPKVERDKVYTQVTHKILKATEDERTRIARELHDGIAQELLLVQIELRKLKYLPEDEVEAGVERASDQLKTVMTHLSTLAGELRPAAMDSLGLGTAIEDHCASVMRAFGVRVRCSIQHIPNLGADKETSLYRIAQEALSNACKYSRSEVVDVTLAADDDAVRLSIQDYGVGFDVEKPLIRGGGLGLAGMRERAGLARGTLAIDSAPNLGTKVTATIPLDNPAAQGGSIAQSDSTTRGASTPEDNPAAPDTSTSQNARP